VIDVLPFADGKLDAFNDTMFMNHGIGAAPAPKGPLQTKPINAADVDNTASWGNTGGSYGGGYVPTPYRPKPNLGDIQEALLVNKPLFRALIKLVQKFIGQVRVAALVDIACQPMLFHAVDPSEECQAARKAKAYTQEQLEKSAKALAYCFTPNNYYSTVASYNSACGNFESLFRAFLKALFKAAAARFRVVRLCTCPVNRFDMFEIDFGNLGGFGSHGQPGAAQPAHGGSLPTGPAAPHM